MPSALVVRSAGLYGVRGSRAKGGSFPERILAAARRGEPLRVVDDQRLNPTWTAPLAQASIDLVNEGAHGIVHVVADGCCSWWDFATATLRVAGVDAPVTRLSTNELNAPAQRPRNGCLRSVRVVALPPWRDELAGWFSEYRSRSA
jgi:dTDP-4-dehydrorhamnose reductase